MSLPADASRKSHAPPKAAAIAGVVFSLLMIVSLVLIRLALPLEPGEPVQWQADSMRQHSVSFALNLVPFAGVAFLWFMGVLRSRVGAQEDQFFATVFLGSGLLFVAILFGSAAWAAGLLAAMSSGSIVVSTDDSLIGFVRETSYILLNVFGIKMAGVFIISTCTIARRTGILPRWVVLVGYACAVVLLLIITRWPWIALLFPLWVLLASAVILLDGGSGEQAAGPSGRAGKPLVGGTASPRRWGGR